MHPCADLRHAGGQEGVDRFSVMLPGKLSVLARVARRSEGPRLSVPPEGHGDGALCSGGARRRIRRHAAAALLRAENSECAQETADIVQPKARQISRKCGCGMPRRRGESVLSLPRQITGQYESRRLPGLGSPGAVAFLVFLAEHCNTSGPAIPSRAPSPSCAIGRLERKLPLARNLIVVFKLIQRRRPPGESRWTKPVAQSSEASNSRRLEAGYDDAAAGVEAWWPYSQIAPLSYLLFTPFFAARFLHSSLLVALSLLSFFLLTQAVSSRRYSILHSSRYFLFLRLYRCAVYLSLLVLSSSLSFSFSPFFSSFFFLSSKENDALRCGK